MPIGVLLHAAAHVVDAGESQPHHTQRVEHLHRVRQLGRQGCAVAAERVQGGDADPPGPLGGLARKPVGQQFSAAVLDFIRILSRPAKRPCRAVGSCRDDPAQD